MIYTRKPFCNDHFTRFHCRLCCLCLSAPGHTTIISCEKRMNSLIESKTSSSELLENTEKARHMKFPSQISQQHSER